MSVKFSYIYEVGRNKFLLLNGRMEESSSYVKFHVFSAPKKRLNSLKKILIEIS